MRKYCFLIVASIILLMVGLSFAQTPRRNAASDDGSNTEYRPSEGLTMFTNLGVTGLDVDGVPGYIEMISSSGKIFYLYIDDLDILRIASPSQVGLIASPNTTDWNNAGESIGRQ